MRLSKRAVLAASLVGAAVLLAAGLLRRSSPLSPTPASAEVRALRERVSHQPEMLRSMDVRVSEDLWWRQPSNPRQPLSGLLHQAQTRLQPERIHQDFAWAFRDKQELFVIHRAGQAIETFFRDGPHCYAYITESLAGKPVREGHIDELYRTSDGLLPTGCYRVQGLWLRDLLRQPGVQIEGNEMDPSFGPLLRIRCQHRAPSDTQDIRLWIAPERDNIIVRYSVRRRYPAIDEQRHIVTGLVHRRGLWLPTGAKTEVWYAPSAQAPFVCRTRLSLRFDYRGINNVPASRFADALPAGTLLFDQENYNEWVVAADKSLVWKGTTKGWWWREFGLPLPVWQFVVAVFAGLALMFLLACVQSRLRRV